MKWKKKGVRRELWLRWLIFKNSKEWDTINQVFKKIWQSSLHILPLFPVSGLRSDTNHPEKDCFFFQIPPWPRLMDHWSFTVLHYPLCTGYHEAETQTSYGCQSQSILYHTFSRLKAIRWRPRSTDGFMSKFIQAYAIRESFLCCAFSFFCFQRGNDFYVIFLFRFRWQRNMSLSYLTSFIWLKLCTSVDLFVHTSRLPNKPTECKALANTVFYESRRPLFHYLFFFFSA